MTINLDPIPISKRDSGQMSLIRVKIPNGFGGLLEHELVVTNPDAIDILNHGDDDINGYSYSQRDHALIPILAKPVTEGDEVEMKHFEDYDREVELDRLSERKGYLEAACDKVLGTNEALAELRAKLVGPNKQHDPVNHPSHYTSHPSGIECIDVTEHFNFNIGNAVKYLWRSGLKETADSIEDLEKAEWYVSREIERLKKAE